MRFILPVLLSLVQVNQIFTFTSYHFAPYHFQLQPHLTAHINPSLLPLQYQQLLPTYLQYFEVSKPLEKEDVEVVIIEDNDESENLTDDVDIIELVEEDSFTCSEVGNYPNPIYCDKYYSCQLNMYGELQV